MQRATHPHVTSHGNSSAQPTSRATHGSTLALLVLVVATSLALAPAAEAQRHASRARALPSAARELAEPFTPPPVDRDVALDIHAGTLAPFLVGAGARVSLPGQLVVGVLFGGIPDPYAHVFGDAASAFGANAGISDLVARFFGAGLALRVEAGIRPVPHQGFELLAHYTALISEPVLATASIDAIAGQSIPWEGNTTLRVNGVLHGFGGEIGWAIVPIDPVVIRLSVGLTYFGAAAFRLGVPEALRASSSVVGEVEHRMASTFTSYGLVPYVSILGGVRIE
jgi:hypothetical protein